MKALIIENPREALRQTVPVGARQQLPAGVVDLLEQQVNGIAVLRVFQGVPPEGTPHPINSLTFREVEIKDGKTYRAHVYGHWAEKVTWTPGLSLNGVGLDADLAVDEEQTVVMGEGVSGGAFGFTGILPSAPTPALGVVKVLAIPMTYADQNAVPSTEAALYSTFRDVGDFYAKGSFGRLTLVGVVTPPVKLKHNEAWYVNRDTSNGGDISGTSVEHAEAREEARKLGFDSSDYDCIVVRHNGGPGSYGGLGGGSSVWARSDSASLWAHEIGHCFGLGHANFWDTAGTSSIGAGANAEYGDTYDNMGSSAFPAGHYNTQAKSQIKWMPSNFVQNVSQSGQYRIYSMDQAVLDPVRHYAMTIVKDAQRTYWCEVRSLFDSNPWVKNGLLFGWRYPNGGGGNLQRIDATPGSPFAKEDAPISLGNTFSDFESGIHITTLAMNDSPRYLDLLVNFGQFPGNRRPSLTLTASAEVVPVGATVTFTATASDQDSDTLAYAWQNFGDATVKIVSPNSSVITRTFATAGSYVVTCTVSDMKGGTITRNQLITVGNGNSRYTISGRVTLLGEGLQDVVLTANGANGVVTDADGYFTIPNLSANTYTLSALLYGYAFGELFNNSVTVGPSFTGAEFAATAQPVVTIAATIPTAKEQAPVTPGRFTVTRTGDTSQALVVNVNPALGSATKGTDYNFSPDYVAGSQGFSTFTIPADAASLDVAVTPITDSLQEGPETVILQLGPGNGYLVGPQSSVTVIIGDDDTVLPKVSLAATTPDTTENSGQPAVFTLTRSGATTANLVVNYSVSGTATNGTDYAMLSGSAIISTGSTSTVVNIAPIDDAESETLETVKLTLLTNAAYLVDPLASNATVNIIDDDTQTVTVVATDSVAQEVDLSQAGAVADTGTFVITRRGDLANPLTVYYSVAGIPGSGVPALHGVDYEALPGVLVIPAGASNASVTITPRYDGIGEGPESAVLALGVSSSSVYGLGTPSSATVTINDNPTDAPYLDVVNISSAAEPATAGTFRITARGGTNTGTITVYYTINGTAVAGRDFTMTGLDTNTLVGTNSIKLNNGATIVSNLTVTPINNSTLDDLRTITLTLISNAAYRTYPTTASATMWLRDDDQPTVYVDTQVATSGSSTVTEGTVSNPTKFYVSRTGATTSPLSVNFTLAGTASPGADYTVTNTATLVFDNVTGTGTLTIPAGALGADVPFAITNDTIFEGTETITFNFTPGSYAHGPGTVMYLADNDTGTVTVGFSSPSSSGSESNTTVNIPVTLSTTSATPVTVEYAVSASTASGTATTVATQSLPYWVRVVRNGSAMTYFEATDGTTWVQRGGPFTVSNLPTNTYYAGLVVASGSATTTNAILDNFSITGLSPGGTTGAENAVNLGNASGGTHTVTSGVYTINTPGNGVLSASTADNFRFIYVPVTNSSNCTVTARLVALGTNTANARVGVMLRADTANQGAIYTAAMANGTGGFIPAYRTTLNSASSTQTAVTTPILPLWFKLERTGDLFRTYSSKDGTNWTNLGATNQTIALGPVVLAGLAVSAKSDGSITTATFDNVNITPAPVGTIQGREIGFVNVAGYESFSSGAWTISGSGNGIGSANDEARFVAAEVSGDFTLVARVVTLGGGASTAQAGVMMRQNRTHYSRQMYAGFINSGSVEQQYRAQSATTAFGAGVDYLLAPGSLTFAPGETNKSITLSVGNDTMHEPNQLITLQLLNANRAAVAATANLHGYTIIDDDAPSANPIVGFAATGSSVVESAGSTNILVSLSLPAPIPVAVDYAVTGGTAMNGGVDYNLPTGTLNFATGESVKEIPITIINDSIIEGNETVVVTLSNPAGITLGSTTNHTLTIIDDDLPIVTLIANDPNAAEAGLDPGQFTVSRTGPTNSSLVVSLTRSGTAISGTDYTAIGTTFTVLAGASNGTINVTPIQDTTSEGNETVILTIATNAAYTVGTASNATVTIADDDRSTVNIVANIPDASETAGHPGQFTVTRTVPTNVSLTVNLTISGTAINGTDYSNVAATVSFAVGASSKTVNIFPIDDSLTEGPEQVTIAIASGSYDIGAAYYDNVTIADNDNPPVLFISSPNAQGPLIASSSGLIVTATVTDDGAPQPVTLQWSQIGGPGTAAFETPTSAVTAVTFSTNGTYVLKVSATDGQFTVSDQVTVLVGPVIAAAEWVTQDMAPSSSRRGQGLAQNGLFTVSGTGTGYAGVTADTAHVMVRQIEGDCRIVARLTNIANASSPLAGLTLRSSLQRGASRAVFGYVPGVGLQFRVRTNINTADAAVTNVGITLPVWLKLERNVASNQITASYAADVAGAPGGWTVVGSPTVISNLGTRVNLGFTTTANSSSNSATAVFDNVTVTPATNTPALIAEELSLTPTEAGSFSASNGVYTIAGSSSGIFYGWQFQGDMMVTVKHADATSGAGSAKSGIRIRESMDSGAYVQVGRIPQGAYNGYIWQSIAGGSSGGVPSFTGKSRWIRIVRKGNSVTAYHAPDVSGAPGTWAQIGQPQTVIMTTPVLVGFNVDNASGVGLNTVIFSNLSIVPLNRAPIVDAGLVAASVIGSTALVGTVADDDFPAPPDLTTLWSSVSGPVPVVFGAATNVATTATFSADGPYRLRLRASDGSVETFEDLSFNAFTSAFAAWQWTNFPGGGTNALAAASADPDGDGLNNLLEYAFGTSPFASNASPVIWDNENIGIDRFFRLTLPKNPAATDLQYEVQAITNLTLSANFWSSNGLVIETNSATTLRVRDGSPMTAPGQRFFRVRVNQP
jgi:regulation of enolase protein 1 (concanavalin A-like superfamily)